MQLETCVCGWCSLPWRGGPCRNCGSLDPAVSRPPGLVPDSDEARPKAGNGRGRKTTTPRVSTTVRRVSTTVDGPGGHITVTGV